MSEQLWWYVARSTGLVAWGLATLAVLGGLALAGRAVRGRPTAAWQTDLHRFVGGASLVFVAAHMAALMADTYIDFDIADLLVPGASSWRPVPVALGVVAFWLLVAVEITSLAKRRMSRRAWSRVHRSSYALWVLATAHLFTAGADAGRGAVVATAIAATAGVFFGSYRLLTRRPRPTRRGGTMAPVVDDAGTPTTDRPVGDRLEPARGRSAAPARLGARGGG